MINNRGITITEVMVAGALFVVILTGLSTVFLASNTSWEKQNANIVTQREVRRALTYLTKDLRAASGVSVTQSSSNVSLSFTHPTAGAVTYTWTNTGANANQIIRQWSTRTLTVGNYITAFSITDTTADDTINVTATSSNARGTLSTYQLSEKVAKR